MKKKHTNLSDFFQEKQKLDSDNSFVDNLISKINFHISKGGKILILTLTKKSSEEITNFLVGKGYRAFYLHSEIATIDRREIITKLRTGEIDIIVGINLLREGIDLPEVSLLTILDADKEGFLRSTTSLIQIIGRASRNPNSEVILYADNMTASIIKALRETYRRRNIQNKFNQKYGITPKKAHSNIKRLTSVKSGEDLDYQSFTGLQKGKVKRLKRPTKKEKEIILKNLREQLELYIKDREFEKATVVRDQIKDISEE